MKLQLRVLQEPLHSSSPRPHAKHSLPRRNPAKSRWLTAWLEHNLGRVALINPGRITLDGCHLLSWEGGDGGTKELTTNIHDVQIHCSTVVLACRYYFALATPGFFISCSAHISFAKMYFLTLVLQPRRLMPKLGWWKQICRPLAYLFCFCVVTSTSSTTFYNKVMVHLLTPRVWCFTADFSFFFLQTFQTLASHRDGYSSFRINSEEKKELSGWEEGAIQIFCTSIKTHTHTHLAPPTYLLIWVTLSPQLRPRLSHYRPRYELMHHCLYIHHRGGEREKRPSEKTYDWFNAITGEV